MRATLAWAFLAVAFLPAVARAQTAPQPSVTIQSSPAVLVDTPLVVHHFHLWINWSCSQAELAVPPGEWLNVTMTSRFSDASYEWSDASVAPIRDSSCNGNTPPHHLENNFTLPANPQGYVADRAIKISQSVWVHSPSKAGGWDPFVTSSASTEITFTPTAFLSADLWSQELDEHHVDLWFSQDAGRIDWRPHDRISTNAGLRIVYGVDIPEGTPLNDVSERWQWSFEKDGIGGISLRPSNATFRSENEHPFNVRVRLLTDASGLAQTFVFNGTAHFYSVGWGPAPSTASCMTGSLVAAWILFRRR